MFFPQNKLQFLVQNKTQKWNHHKSRKNKGIGDGGEVELGAKVGEAMKIGVRAVSEVRGARSAAGVFVTIMGSEST